MNATVNFTGPVMRRSEFVVCDNSSDPSNPIFGPRCGHRWKPEAGQGFRCPACGVSAEHGTARLPCPKCGVAAPWIRKGLVYTCKCPCLLPQAARANHADHLAKRAREEAEEQATMRQMRAEAKLKRKHEERAGDCWAGRGYTCGEAPPGPHAYCQHCPRWTGGKRRPSIGQGIEMEETDL